MKKILVMGGNQFVGKEVAKKLLEKNYKVYVLNRGIRKNLDNVIFLKADRKNISEMKNILKNIEVDNIIVGTYITKSNNYKEKIKSIKERTMLQNTKEMLLKAKKEKYSVGAFNFTNLETLQGILEAAEEEKSPVILQTSSSAIKYMGLRIYCKND